MSKHLLDVAIKRIGRDEGFPKGMGLQVGPLTCMPGQRPDVPSSITYLGQRYEYRCSALSEAIDQWHVRAIERL